MDNTMLAAVSSPLSSMHGTEATMVAATQLFQFIAIHIRMPPYTFMQPAHSHLGLSFLLGNNATLVAPGPDSTSVPFHGPILVDRSVFPCVVASLMEAKLDALSFNAQDCYILCTVLVKRGHPKLAAPIQTDQESVLVNCFERS
jgi:hypothetical protein